MTSSSILLRLTRGSLTESVHRGSIAVTDDRGNVISSAGDPYAVTYARSSMKPVQAIPVIESGAADAYGFTPEEIAILCASHNGEEKHIATVKSMLTKIGLTSCSLQCGPHDPYDKASADRLKEAGEKPTELHNNCSGKHAGMLALSRHMRVSPERYLEPTHPVQIVMRSTVGEMAGMDDEEIILGIDGCGVPVFGLPLFRLAAAFARLGTAASEPTHRGEAAARILNALRRHPFQIAGTGRYDTRLIEVTNGRIIGKMGAEGVFALTVPELGLGLALKIEDGTQRAIYPVVTEALVQLGWLSPEEAAGLAEFHKQAIRNWKGTVVGGYSPDFKLTAHAGV